jgi:leucyl-tRNA synthetase
MAYYTIAHLLQGETIDGSAVGPLGVKAEDMTHQCWDYIFKKGAYPAECKVTRE